MRPANHLINVEAARVAAGRDGYVTVDDPNAPWIVQVKVKVYAGRVYVTGLRVESRSTVGITAARLAKLPMGQLRHVAGGYLGHPNETYYRMLAQPKDPGRRSWPDEHWGRVLQVYDWARESGRPGGGYRAVADLWDVSIAPTAQRWVTEARRRQKGLDQ